MKKKELNEEKPLETVVEPVETPTEEEVQEQVEKLVANSVANIESKMQAEMEAKVESWKAEQAELMKKRSGVYNPEVKSTRKELNTKTRSFINALYNNDLSVIKDLVGGTDNKGGYLIFDELEAEIQHLVTEYGAARREMYPVQLSRGDLKLNNLASDVNVYWTDEAAAKTSSDVTLGQVKLELKKIAVIVPMSDELLEDSEIDIVSFLTGRIAEKMAQKEDLAFFLGDGGAGYGGFTGILNNALVNTVTMTGSSILNLDTDDLLDMIDNTPSGALANAKFYLNRTLMSLIRNLKDNNGFPIFQAPSASGPMTIWGYPVVLVEALPSTGDDADDTPFILFGDLKKACWFGYKGGMRVAISNEATVRNTDNDGDLDLFRQDMSALRVVERVGYVTVVPKAVTVLFTAVDSV